MAKTTASASGRNRKPGTPFKKKMGTKTMQMLSVATKAGVGNLLRAGQDGFAKRHAFRQQAVDVFNLHRGVVHQDPHRQSQATERHDVDGFAERAHHQQRRENGQRNGNGHDQRAAPAPEEQQNQRRRQAGGDNRFAQDADRPRRGRRWIDRSEASFPGRAAMWRQSWAARRAPGQPRPAWRPCRASERPATRRDGRRSGRYWSGNWRRRERTRRRAGRPSRR